MVKCTLFAGWLCTAVPHSHRRSLFSIEPLSDISTNTFDPIRHDGIRWCPHSAHCSSGVGLMLALVRNVQTGEQRGALLHPVLPSARSLHPFCLLSAWPISVACRRWDEVIRWLFFFRGKMEQTKKNPKATHRYNMNACSWREHSGTTEFAAITFTFFWPLHEKGPGTPFTSVEMTSVAQSCGGDGYLLEDTFPRLSEKQREAELWQLLLLLCSRKSIVVILKDLWIGFISKPHFSIIMKQCKFSCLNYWCPFPYVGQQKELHYGGKRLPCHYVPLFPRADHLPALRTPAQFSDICCFNLGTLRACSFFSWL